MIAKQGIPKDHRYGKTNMANRCKVFEALNLILHGHYRHVCTVLKVIGINTENKMSAKQGIHKCSLMMKINMVVKCIVYLTAEITAELKAYWLSWFSQNYCKYADLWRNPCFTESLIGLRVRIFIYKLVRNVQNCKKKKKKKTYF